MVASVHIGKVTLPQWLFPAVPSCFSHGDWVEPADLTEHDPQQNDVEVHQPVAESEDNMINRLPAGMSVPNANTEALGDHDS